jgi:hypothetical protein
LHQHHSNSLLDTTSNLMNWLVLELDYRSLLDKQKQLKPLFLLDKSSQQDK